ncbi:hypothetical protein Hypma_014114 [Hypsizygus marmoreus]|uniref:Uncharacterized protein n=1 Tax=Hypsizygus marmoreus TaxID=39966 RepID=A0A369KAU9_HYPMA|nr:hypothetical protein Hypma_014114 [Hypsizygus marmoreus]
MGLADFDEDAIQLAVSLAIARLSRLEGPWYGPWGLYLHRRLGRVKLKSDNGTEMVVPIVYSQYPVGITHGDLLDVEGNDTVPHRQDISDVPSPTKDKPIPIWSSDPPSSPSPKSAELQNHSPAAPRRDAHRAPLTTFQTAAPLPSLLSVMASMADNRHPQTRPRTQSHHVGSAALTPDDKEMLKAAYKIWSTRIPDFARCIYLVLGSDIVMMRWDLLIEIKKKLQQPDSQFQLLDFLNVHEQVEGQAEHVFASNPNVDVIGGIMALGDVWIYQEYHRPRDLSGVGTDDRSWRREKNGPDSDGSSVDSETSQETWDPRTSPGSVHNPIPPFPRDLRRIAILGTAQSDAMLDMIGTRLETLNNEIWQGSQVQTTTTGKDTLDSEMSNAPKEDEAMLRASLDIQGEGLRWDNGGYHHPVLGLYCPPPDLGDFTMNLVDNDPDSMYWNE